MRNYQGTERVYRVKDCNCKVEEPLTYCTPTGSNYCCLGPDYFSWRVSIFTSIMVQPRRGRYKTCPCPKDMAQSSKWPGCWGHSEALPSEVESIQLPSKPLVKGNQAHRRPANSEGIKAVMKFTAGLASPSNGPARQWHRLLLARM